MRTLFIQIDNNSLPDGCGEDVEVLDCRCINDFCSLVGDALVGDLKDENGKPLYRLINPVGKLLMDFKEVNEKTFNSIIEDWFDILGNLLHKGMQGDDIVIHFPQQYVDWLLHSDNPYYGQVGKELQRQNGKITLSSEAIDDDVIASINYKVSHKLQEKKEDYSFVVFSNPIIRNSSFVIKKVRLDGIVFMRYDSWQECSTKNKVTPYNTIILNTDDIFTQEKQFYKEFTVKGVSFKMIYVENGVFMMGANPEWSIDAYYDNEIPQHIVKVGGFYLGETVVTEALWEAVMGYRHEDNNYKWHPNELGYQGPNFPVHGVIWDDIQTFLLKLTSITKIRFRLPTEPEWEFAARGGNQSRGYIYSGSDNIDEVAWYSGNSNEQMHPVAIKKPNELGLYDMSGNVSEWCNSRYRTYDNSFVAQGSSPGEDRVVRGGRYFDPHDDCRVTRRVHGASSTGFRLAI